MTTRRAFTRLLYCAAVWPVVWPGPVKAQTRPLPIIGFLNAVERAAVERFNAGFRRGLMETGFEDGRNVRIEHRYADGHYDRLADLAAEIVRLNVAVIVAGGGPPTVLAAKAATSEIPIVFTGVSDPLQEGIVAGLHRPGGNITGISILGSELDAKRLELLCEMVPTARTIAVLVNPRRPDSPRQLKEIGDRAAALRRASMIFPASDSAGIEAAFDAIRVRGLAALVVLADSFFNSRRERIVRLAARYRVLAIYQWREFALAGGLMSYGPNLIENYRQAGIYAGRILKGEKPGDLPVLQPTNFELVINLGAAKALNLAVPETLVVAASEVID